MRRAPGLERRWSAVAAIVATLTLSGSGAAAAAPSGWTRIEHPALVGGNSISYVMDVLPPERGSGWLAGGFVVDPDGIRTPAVWGSRDGATWRRTALPPAPSTEPRDGVSEIAGRGDVAVAVGERFTNGSENRRVARDGWQVVAAHRRGRRPPPLRRPNRGRDRVADRLSRGRLGCAKHAGGGARVRGRAVVASAEHDPASRRRAVQPLRDHRGGRTRPGLGRGPHSRAEPGPNLLLGRLRLGAGRSGEIGDDGPRPHAGRVPRLPAAARVRRRWARTPGHGRAARCVVIARRRPLGTAPGERGAVPHRRGGSPFDRGRGRALRRSGELQSGPVLWQTSDGQHWSTIDAPTKRNVADWANVTVASTGPVTVLAVAGDGAADAYRRGPAGRWSVIDRAPAFPGASGGVALLRDVAASRDRLVAVGHDARGRALILTSANARSWSRAPLPDPHARLEAVAVSHGVFAVAGRRLLKGKAHVALWTSTNGRRWRRLGGGALDPVGAFVDVAPDGAGFVLGAFEGSPRGLQVSTWSAGARGLTPGRILGPGETRAICSGPHGATVIATRGAGRDEQVLAWHRRSGVWSRASETVAASAEAADCADGPTGTLVVGSGATGGTAVAWTQDSAGAPWRPMVLADTPEVGALRGDTRRPRLRDNRTGRSAGAARPRAVDDERLGLEQRRRLGAGVLGAGRPGRARPRHVRRSDRGRGRDRHRKRGHLDRDRRASTPPAAGPS